MLDTYDVSLAGRPVDDPRYALAKDILFRRNPNRDKNDPTSLGANAQRFVAFNGGVSQAQLDWLQRVLEQSRRDRERVIVFSHTPIHHSAALPIGLCWNTEEILEILGRFKGNVVACFAGHTHENFVAVCPELEALLQTLPSILECQPGSNAYGVVEITAGGRMRVKGVGEMASAVHVFPPLP